MLTLGINAAFHDSSACIVKDGMVIAAVEEERFNRVKHAKRPIPLSAYELPFYSIDFCLKEAGVNLSDVDYIAYSYDPRIRSNDKRMERMYDPQFLGYIIDAPMLLADGVPLSLKKRFLGFQFPSEKTKWVFVEHHSAHAASAFFPSPFEEAAILTIDGRGEVATTTYNIGYNTEIKRITQVDMPDSLGILYERLTEYLGFLHSCDEGKVMALAAYGKPRYLNRFRSIIKIGENGNYTIEEFDLRELFGPPRESWEKITEKHCDIASSLQKFLEETVLKLVNFLYEETKISNLCLAGGVFLNCSLNSYIRDNGPFKKIWVQPAAGDAGTALGAALLIDAFMRKERNYRMNHVFLGPKYDDNEIETILINNKLSYKKMKNVAKETAEILAENKVVGWFQGRMEFGPRALGGRSILASPVKKEMKDILNRIKGREEFRPVAPVILENEVGNWFKNKESSPYMLFVYDVLPEKKKKIPAAIHIDGTARIQTINRNQHPLYFDMIKEFERITGLPLLINTSFNIAGEPIVCTPQHAIKSFFSSPLDALVIGSYLLKKQ
jgi:carbamoyltransferase